MVKKSKSNVIDFGKEAAKRGKSIVTKSVPKVSQVVERGNNNTQIAGNNNTTNLNITTKASPQIKIQPSPNSIGGNPMLRIGIKERFNELGDRRKARVGDSAFGVMYSSFKREFGIEKNVPWTIIWDWPVECADKIIEYLDEKLANTIQGRIENAGKKAGYIHAKPFLFARERELLSCLGWEPKSFELRRLLSDFFGVDSHADLTHLQLWQLVCHLEGLVKDMVGE